MKKSQILGTNFSYTQFSFDYFISSISTMDVDRIEFYACYPHMYLYDVTPAEAFSVFRKLHQAGLAVEVFTAEQCNYPISISISDPLVYRRSLDYYFRALDCAETLESPHMQMVTGPGFLCDSHEEDFKRAEEAMYQIVRIAEKKGISIYLENDPNTSVRNSDDIMRMIRNIGSPNLEGLIDTNGIYGSGEDFAYAVKNLGKHLKHLHFIDFKEPDKYCLIPGTGDLPLEEYLKVLDKAGFEGTMTPELWGSTYLDDPDSAMRQSMEYLRAHAE